MSADSRTCPSHFSLALTLALLAPLVGTVIVLIDIPTTMGADRAVEPIRIQGLEGWRAPMGDWEVVQAVALDSADPKRFTTTPGKGVLLNGRQGRTVDLLTKSEFGDAEVHVEFCISRQSNSGVYLMYPPGWNGRWISGWDGVGWKIDSDDAE